MSLFLLLIQYVDRNHYGWRMARAETNSSFEQSMPSAFRQLANAADIAEKHFRDVCDIEFTVQNGQVFVLGVRPARRTPVANIRFALQFFAEGKIGPQEVLRRVAPSDVSIWLLPLIRNRRALRLVGRGLPASSGVATGKVVLQASDALNLAATKVPVILVRNEVSPGDLRGIMASQGVLTIRGGMSSHSALACRQMEKPCVCGFNAAGHSFQSVNDVRSVFRTGSWITINGSTGEVFEGKAKFKANSWRDCPEIVALAQIVSWAVDTANIPHDAVGQTWRMSDFFRHSAPLTRGLTNKKAVTKTKFVSFETPARKTLKLVGNSLKVLGVGERKNYSEILLSLMDSQLRIMSSAIGLGNHPQYFRPLWDPKMCVRRSNEDRGTQLVGIEFFNLNRYVPHLIDVATITILLELDVRDERMEWFLDSTNPKGESLVVGSESVRGYRLLVNDVEVSHDDVPQFYDSLRRREYNWQFFQQNGVTYGEIVTALCAWDCNQMASPALVQLAFELGLFRNGALTLAGQSILGKMQRKKKYEFIAKRNSA
jgi:phosphohistidine swiveling domain-containing protein